MWSSLCGPNTLNIQWVPKALFSVEHICMAASWTTPCPFISSLPLGYAGPPLGACAHRGTRGNYTWNLVSLCHASEHMFLCSLDNSGQKTYGALKVYWKLDSWLCCSLTSSQWWLRQQVNRLWPLPPGSQVQCRRPMFVVAGQTFIGLWLLLDLCEIKPFLCKSHLEHNGRALPPMSILLNRWQDRKSVKAKPFRKLAMSSSTLVLICRL